MELEQSQGLSLHELWSLGLSAVLTEMNEDDHFSIGDQRDAPHIRNALQRDWDVSNSQELKDTIDWCVNDGGHRNEFFELGASLKFMNTSNIDAYINVHEQIDEKRAARLKLAHAYRDSLGEQGIKAFDLGRAVMLCRWGFVAGWLSEEEVWGLIEPIAKEAKASFNSWESYAVSYVVGSHYVRGNISEVLFDQFSGIIKWLLMEEESPWVVSPWIK